MDDRQFTPEEFAIWLHGYSSAKPEILDEQTRSALHGVIAFLTGRKLRGMSERAALEGLKAGKIANWPPAQPSPTYVGSPTWVTDNTAAPIGMAQTVTSP
jgi:hypothetical protein